jgi:hypothetical protein
VFLALTGHAAELEAVAEKRQTDEDETVKA